MCDATLSSAVQREAFGLDTCFSILGMLYAGFTSLIADPAPLWREKTDAGELRRKTVAHFLYITSARREHVGR